MARAKASLLFGVALLTLSDLQAQVSPPLATDFSPTVNTEVSSLIHTGCGYDAWTGSVHRSVTDLEVPGAVSSLGLKWVRTYNSGNPASPWSFSWTWRYWGRAWPDPIGVRLPDGGIWRTIEPGTKLRFWRSCNGGPNCLTGEAKLYLEDGSVVHMNFWVDPPDDYRNYPIDYFTPDYVDDPYGRRTTLEYEEACVFGYEGTIRLKQVTDPSGRWIRITYGCDASDCQHCNNSNWWKITRVDGSDGSWVTYTPDAFMPTHVAYSDGTSADYRYGNTTYLMDTICCPGGNCRNYTITANATKLIAAWDTHADSPMQSIYYAYKAPGRFEGQILAEKQLASASPTASPVQVWRFQRSPPTRVRPTLGHKVRTARVLHKQRRVVMALRVPSMQQAAQHVPLVKRKSDFNGINEVYIYDGNNYLTDVTDRNGSVTHYTNEQVIATRPKSGIRIRHTSIIPTPIPTIPIILAPLQTNGGR